MKLLSHPQASDLFNDSDILFPKGHVGANCISIPFTFALKRGFSPFWTQWTLQKSHMNITPEIIMIAI